MLQNLREKNKVYLGATPNKKKKLFTVYKIEIKRGFNNPLFLFTDT